MTNKIDYKQELIDLYEKLFYEEVKYVYEKVFLGSPKELQDPISKKIHICKRYLELLPDKMQEEEDLLKWYIDNKSTASPNWKYTDEYESVSKYYYLFIEEQKKEARKIFENLKEPIPDCLKEKIK